MVNLSDLVIYNNLGIKANGIHLTDPCSYRDFEM